MSIINQAHFFNKLRRHLGLLDAIKTYISLRVTMTGKLKLHFIKHPFQIRIGNRADMETLNEVILRKAYDIDTNFLPKTIIDGGANIGLTSIFFASKYPSANIIAIEPAGNNYQLLQQNTKPYKNISCLQAAIWHANTRLQLNDTGRGDNSFTVSANTNTGTVDAITIKDIMQANQFDCIDILKLDIEGAESHVFNDNFEYWLPKTKVLIIELHPKISPNVNDIVTKAINQYNFSCKQLGANLVFTNNSLV